MLWWLLKRVWFAGLGLVALLMFLLIGLLADPSVLKEDLIDEAELVWRSIKLGRNCL